MIRRAEEAAEALLAELGVSKPAVDVHAIAEALGVHIVNTNMDHDLSGMLIREDDDLAIGVNKRHHRVRQRFTVAHEVGHLRLHRGRPLIVDSTVRVNFRDKTSATATNREEIEANAFAAALLMPQRWVLDRASGLNLDGQQRLFDVLAPTFDVSPQAMQFRLINLGLIASY